VLPQWNEWRAVRVRVRDLNDIQWLQPRGAPRALIHAHVSPRKLVGRLAGVAEGPEPVLVCILKSHTAADIYEELQRRANERTTPHGPDARVGVVPRVVQQLSAVDSRRLVGAIVAGAALLGIVLMRRSRRGSRAARFDS